MKLYLSGPMTGYENFNFPEFFRIAEKLRKLGNKVVSPAEFDIQNGWVKAEFLLDGVWHECDMSMYSRPDRFRTCQYFPSEPHRFIETGAATYEEMLEKDCKVVEECDGIVLMPGWERSGGVQKELRTAIDADLSVYTWAERLGAPKFVHPSTARRLLTNAVIARGAADYSSATDEPMPHEMSVSRTTSGSVRINMGKIRQLRTPEQHEVTGVFIDLLLAATGDGGKKRATGSKPSWKVDPSHEAAIFSHLCKWKKGEKVDKDSGVHPLAHAAWRCLAIAAQETAANGMIPEAPSGASLDYPVAHPGADLED